MKIHGLVGKSGTGKSHNALRIASSYAIDSILDDGLLIRNAQILCGESAKNEKTTIASVKRAIFTEDADALEIRNSILKNNISKLLIIGTSKKMLFRICKRINIPEPTKIINIEECVNKDYINSAQRKRKINGYHTIPVQNIEVHKRYPEIVFKNVFQKIVAPFKNSNNQDNDNHTIVTPIYDQRNKISIIDITLKQIVSECIKCFNKSLEPNKIVLKPGPKANSITIKVFAGLHYGVNLHDVAFPLQQHICRTLTKMAGINVSNVEIVFNKLILTT